MDPYVSSHAPRVGERCAFPRPSPSRRARPGALTRRRARRRARQREKKRRTRRRRRGAVLLVLWSPKGGSGTSVLAAACALVLGRRGGARIADLDGDQPALFGLAWDRPPGTGALLRWRPVA